MSVPGINGNGQYPVDRSEEEAIEIPRRAPTSTRLGNQIDGVALDILREAVSGFVQPILNEYQNIDVVNEGGYLLRYEIPQLSFSDYLRPVHLQGYCGLQMSVGCYDPKFGCYVQISLRKTREQSEDDYAEILQELNCSEQHALWTEAQRDWGAVYQRRFNPTEYRSKSQERRVQQLEGIKKVVEYWKKTNLFAEVFSPNTRYSAVTLGIYPELVALFDRIIFVYKEVPPLHHRSKPSSCGEVLTTISPVRWTDQEETRRRFDEKNRSLYQKAMRKVTTYFPSIPWPRRESGPTTTTVDPPLQIGPPPQQELTQTDAPESSFFFQEGGGANGSVGVRLFRSVSRIARNIWDCLARLFDILRGRIGARFAENVVRSESADLSV